MFLCLLWFSDPPFDPTGPPLNLSNHRVYGEPLQEHLSQSSREIAVPIQECIHMLLRTGMREEVRSVSLFICTPLQRGPTFAPCPPGSVPSGSRRLGGEEAENLFGPRNGGPQRVQHGPSRRGWSDSFCLSEFTNMLTATSLNARGRSTTTLMCEMAVV